MIRINLLGIKKELPRAAMPSVAVEGAKVTVIFVVVVVLAVGALFYHYRLLASEADRLAQRMAAAQAEKTRLAQVKAEVELFEKRKQQYLSRINTIERLKASQTGPVTLLTSLANSVQMSEHLWLTNFVADSTKVSINGVASNVNTVADFIANLRRTGQFKTVEIQESFQDDKFKEIPTFVFTITAERVPPTVAQPTTGGSKT